MRALFFDAVAGAAKSSVASALAHQARATLGPFQRYLGQAIHTARQRQSRYQLPWDKVRSSQRVNLDPRDCLVRVPRRLPGWRITDWPADVEPDLHQPLMVVNRGVTLDVLDHHRDADGVVIHTADELRDQDAVWWCGQSCTLARELTPPAPSVLHDRHGEPLRLARNPVLDPDDDSWILVLEGRRDVGDLDDLVIDGQRVTPTALQPSHGLRRLSDRDGRTFELRAGRLEVEELPAEGELVGDNGVRFHWSAKRSGRSGNWVQLLPPETLDSESFLDPRAAFCEGDVREVWTQQRHDRNAVYKVKKVDSERYQLLLDRLPPRDRPLLLPVNIRNLQLQRRALNQLADAPLPHHQGLLRLCEHPEHVRWPPVRPAPTPPDDWTTLTDESRSGTDEQRAFVAAALASPDVAILEGPPGSGKTTAICELVQQLLAKRQRVLLCASTHVAIDNVLERLIAADAPVDAVRIGRLERVDDAVQATQIDHKVEALVDAWRAAPHLAGLSDTELQAMATRAVVMACNLTCGTTMGIVNHPLFADHDRRDGRGNRGLRPWERPITTMPHWDVLIIDEASKTLIQEFMVPALMARRWIIVGDVRQLPPFTDRADIVANLRSLVDGRDRPLFPAAHQRACLLRSRLGRRALRDTGARWLIVEPPGVLDWLEKELAEAASDDRSSDEGSPTAVRVVARVSRRDRRGPPREPEPDRSRVLRVDVARVRAGEIDALMLAGCDWVLVGDDLLAEVADHLPADLLHHRDLTRPIGAGDTHTTTCGERGLRESHPLFFRHRWWLSRSRSLQPAYRERGAEITTFDQAERHEQRWLSEHDLASEMTWRLTRIHELRRSQAQRERERLQRALRRLQPRVADIAGPIAEIQDIGLPSILEVLQEGIGADRSSRPSALTEGMKQRQPVAFTERFASLSYQHRMHPEISLFPREYVYRREALQDANTIASRDERLGWNFAAFRSRRTWIDVRGQERGGVNRDEIAVMEQVVRDFVAWARDAGAPGRSSPRVWQVACLCFYVKQEGAISDMLRQLSSDDRRTRFTMGNVEIVCGTVDRFQGREADLVLLSMRNTRRVGFLDSLNRLNVAITRARQQLVVVGNARYFGERCRVPELQALVRRSQREDGRRWLASARSSVRPGPRQDGDTTRRRSR